MADTSNDHLSPLSTASIVSEQVADMLIISRYGFVQVNTVRGSIFD